MLNKDKMKKDDSREYFMQCINLNWSRILSPWLVAIIGSGMGLSYCPASHVAWRAGMTILYRRSALFPPVRDYEFG